LAWAIDLIVLFVVGLLIRASHADVELRSLLTIALGWLYFALMESSPMQGTLGKSVAGLAVTDDELRRIGFRQASGRYLAKALSALMFGVGFFMIRWTDRRKGLHDLLACTVVVRRSSRWTPRRLQQSALTKNGSTRGSSSETAKTLGFQPVGLFERWVLFALAFAAALMFESFGGPWWRDQAVGYVSGGDKKGAVLLALLLMGIAILIRFVTPVRPAWLYPIVLVGALIAVVKIAGLPTYQGINATWFLWSGLLGSLVGAVIGLAGFIVGLREALEAGAVARP
jgi:uncharacterized RDD family membrane protein YckC